MRTPYLALITAIVLSNSVIAAPQHTLVSRQTLPRTIDGKPDLKGIWQASSTADADLQDHAAAFNMLAGRSVVVTGGTIPYQLWAAAKRAENFQNRQKADPLGQCYLPGIPRIMYMEFPFQIFQTPQAVAIAFEWSLVYRLIYTNGSQHPTDIDSWMGDSRGRWDGDTLVVDVSNYNDKTWFDMAGDFHSDALHVVERYRMTGPDTIRYEATIEDSKVFTKPWTIGIDLERRKDRDRLFEYNCEAEAEEVSGAFTRDDRTWWPGPASSAGNVTPPPAIAVAAVRPAPAIPPAIPPAVAASIRRMPDGKPDLQGLYESRSG